MMKKSNLLHVDESYGLKGLNLLSQISIQQVKYAASISWMVNIPLILPIFLKYDNVFWFTGYPSLLRDDAHFDWAPSISLNQDSSHSTSPTMPTVKRVGRGIMRSLKGITLHLALYIQLSINCCFIFITKIVFKTSSGKPAKSTSRSATSSTENSMTDLGIQF